MFSRLFGSPLPSISATELNEKLSDPKAVFLLDVREPYEYQAGHIAGAALIPLGQLRQRLNELPKSAQVVCICQSGNRSVTATRFLKAAGLEAVNMKNGMIAWQRAGLPIVRGTARQD